MPGTITYPLTELTFDTVTTGAYTSLQQDMTLLLGTTSGGDDLGRVRVQNAATSTTIPVGRVSEGSFDGELLVTDNAYITVWGDDWRVWSKTPYIDDAGKMYKDSTIEVGDYTGVDTPPVANCGPGVVASVSGGIITVTFDATNSFAVADGATIATYAWDVGDGTITIGTSASATPTATFPAGFRWVSLTVVDSNGTPHTARCPVLAINPASDVTLPYGAFVIERHEADEAGGQQLDVRFVESIPYTTYPDGTLVMLWDGEPSGPTDRTNVQFIGWHQSDQANTNATRTGTITNTVLRCVDVAGRLASLPGFPQSLERATDPNNWDQMVNPTMAKYLHYLLLWHSTALSLADYLPDDSLDGYPFVLFDSDGESLFDQVNNEARRLVPQHALMCNRRGQLSVVADPMLQDSADRVSSTQGTITEDYTESIQFDTTRPPRVHWLRGHAVLIGTDYTVVDGVDTLLTVHCIAPGLAPGQGLGELETNEGLAKTQAALNSAKGHEYARLNSRYGLVRVVPPDEGTYNGLDPASRDWIALAVSATTAAQRGFVFSSVRTQCKHISFRYEQARTGTIRRSEFTLEIETIGRAALTVVPVDLPTTPTTPPSFGLIEGYEQVAGIDLDGNVYVTTDFQTASGSGGPTWVGTSTGITEAIYTWVVDPFSPGYVTGAGAINGWVATEDAIYKLNDLFGTLSVDTAYTFATTAAAASFHWRTIQASFGAFFGGGLNPWLVCVSYYGDTSGHAGTWATYSVDGGVTWSSEVQISAYYDATTPTRFSPIGLYTSPKTPGLAYTAASVSTAGGALPRWSIWDDEAGVYTDTGLGATATVTSVSTAGPLVDQYLTIAPPPNTKRMVITGTWSSTYSSPSGGACASVVQILDDNLTDQTDDLSHSGPVPDTADGTTTGSFTAEFTFPTYASADWPYNTSNYASAGFGNASRVRAYSDTTSTAVCTTIVSITVTEIELDDGTIYDPSATDVDGFVSTDWGASWTAMGYTLIVPGAGYGGTIHLPWEDNASEQLALYGSYEATTVREFRLKSANGASVSDISPVDTGVTYGVNRPHFGVRAYDSDRQFLLLAGMGNETSLDPADDKHAIFYSANYGTSWANIVAAIADSGAPTNRPAFEAAFAGDTPTVQYYWGPPGYISTSSDSGASVDDRSGDIPGTADGFVGIAGGTA